jgi:hypothetical protein
MQMSTIIESLPPGLRSYQLATSAIAVLILLTTYVRWPHFLRDYEMK